MKLAIAAMAAMCVWAGDAVFVVTDAGGLPVNRVRVVARHASTGQTATCETGNDGKCSIAGLARGPYVVTGRAEGLLGRQEAQLSGGDEQVAVALQPEAMRQSVTVVSGSRQEELQDESPIKVEAVTRQQIERTGYERVSDVLQEIPGVLVRRGSTSTVGGEQIQGIDSRQVLVLQDGLPVLGARGIKSGVVNLNRQTTGRLARVEVAKGAGSATYGSDAIGGVINMITQEPVQPIEAGLLLSGGSLGMFDGRGDVGGRHEKLTYFLTGGVSNMDSYSLIPNSPTTVGPQIRREDILFKTRYQILPKFALGFTANAYWNRELGRNASETGLVDGRNDDSLKSYALVGDWTIDNATMLQFRGYASRFREDSRTTAIGRVEPPARANLDENLNRLDATLSRQFSHGHFVQGGAEWAQTVYRGVNRLVGDNAGQQVTATDGWVQDKWTLGRATMTIGGRVTNHSMFGRAAVPKAGIVYRLTDSWILRGSFGMGFRAPDLGQLYYRFANPASFYQVVGNPTLRPEYSQSFQVGTMYRHRRGRLGVGLFRNNIRDLIESRNIGTPTNPAALNALLEQYGIPPQFNPLLGRQLFIYLNLNRVYTEGVEVDGEFSVTRNLRVTGAYTYLQALDRVTRLALTQRHRHSGNVRTEYVHAPWGLVANVRGTFYSNWFLNAATGTRALPYQIWDAYVSKDFPKGLQTFLAADNFNNSRDGKLALPTPTFDRPDYGRTYRVGLRYRLGARE